MVSHPRYRGLSIAAIYWFTRPLSEASLRKRAEALLVQPELESHYTARDDYLRQIVARFPTGENVDWPTNKSI